MSSCGLTEQTGGKKTRFGRGRRSHGKAHTCAPGSEVARKKELEAMASRAVHVVHKCGPSDANAHTVFERAFHTAIAQRNEKRTERQAAADAAAAALGRERKPTTTLKSHALTIRTDSRLPSNRLTNGTYTGQGGGAPKRKKAAASKPKKAAASKPKKAAASKPKKAASKPKK